MPPEGQAPDVTPAPSAEQPTTTPAAPSDTTPQPSSEGQPNVSEDVTTPGSEDKSTIPYDRFKEVNDKAKAEAEKREALEAELAELRGQKTTPETPPEDEVQLDPEAQKLLDNYLKQKGFVTQESLDAEKLRLQADSDVRELKGEFADFDKDKVLDYAKEKGLLINDKNGLRSVYNLMKSGDTNYKDSLRNEIIAELTESGQLKEPGLQKPGPGGPNLTPGEKPVGTRNILRAAIAKHAS